MSSSVGVFIGTVMPLAELAKEAGELLGLKFEYQKDEYDEWYAVRTEEGLIDIGAHELDNDRDMNFEDYKYEIRFWVNRDKEPEEREMLQQDVGSRIFKKLKATRQYPLMYVYDNQQKLDGYSP